MEIKVSLKLKPFNVPNFVIVEMPPGKRENMFTEAPKVSLRELDQETLEKLCDEFTTEVFKKAGKKKPTQAV